MLTKTFYKIRDIGRPIKGDKLPKPKRHLSLEQQLTAREQRKIRRDLARMPKVINESYLDTVLQNNPEYSQSQYD